MAGRVEADLYYVGLLICLTAVQYFGDLTYSICPHNECHIGTGKFFYRCGRSHNVITVVTGITANLV